MELKDKVLGFLKKEVDYKSGQEISEQIGVTRSAVWKVIKKLQQEGYQIDSSTKKGYRLVETPNIITAAEVRANLKTEYLGHDIDYNEVIDSTNIKAKALARSGKEEGTLVIADCQEGGKGRLGRAWASPSGTGIWMSLILRPKILPQYASQITLVAGLSMCEAIREATGLDVQIKWPNDLVVNGKKVCGILTEMSAEMEGVNYIILGIGVNVNTMSFEEELPFATSLAKEAHEEFSRKDIIVSFLEKFEKDYTIYKTFPSLEKFLSRYEENCITLHKKVKLIKNEEERIATALHVTKEGSLVVQLEDGSIEEVISGEISVRGLYGYI